jgi:hypothetical protein
MKNQFFSLTFGLIISALTLFGSPTGQSDYVAHEWGTFTSVQAADGIQMQWHPLTEVELPSFVYSLAWPEGRKPGKENLFAIKSAFTALQRMETPVIYFYSEKPRSVDVSIDFPKGVVTEWFPQASKANPFGELEMAKPIPAHGKIDWQGVEILEKAKSPDPHFANDPSGSHYYAARGTDANPIRISSKGTTETEKFLFYRGVASFRAPLLVAQQGSNAETIELHNMGSEELRSLFIYQIRDGRAAWATLPGLITGDAKTVHLDFNQKAVSLSQFHDSVAPELTRALVAEGLYPREASAMVKTWDDSWFNEQGVRVLYILPRHWTDETLPLKLSPAPRESSRVMVGRAEMVTPEMETTLFREMTRYSQGGEHDRNLAIENARKLGLGRFAEPVMRRVIAKNRGFVDLFNGVPQNQQFENRAWELLQSVSKAPTESKPLAQN